MASPPARHRLGPHVVGQRVVVRHLLPDGRATDVLGTCTAWGADAVVIRVDPRRGEPGGHEMTIPLATVVTGKPVPPRAPVRDRMPARALHELGNALFPDLETAPLDGWLLRSSVAEPARRRANSVLTVPGDSGLDSGPDSGLPEDGLPDDAVVQVVDWYAARGRRPVASVLPGSAAEQAFVAAGWGPESADADTLFQLGSVATALRVLGDPPAFAIQMDAEGPDGVRAHFGDDAHGRAVCRGDWVGLAAVEVAPARRRHGLGLGVVAALLEWAAERGARTAYLHVLADNDPALALYARLGFTTHHTYRYLAPPT